MQFQPRRSPIWGLMLLLSVIVGLTQAARAEVRSELRWSSDSFLSPSYDTTGPSTSQFFGAAFSNTEAVSDLRVDLRGAYAVGEPLLSYFNVKEFAYTTTINEDQTFAVGRKKQNWSELDRRWNFGLIEPVFKWNPLSPETQGLTGLFWAVGQKNLRLSLFGSLIYIPEQGASFDIDSEGRFVRGNPWFRRPPESIRIFSEVSQIEYNFDRPREADIVFQPSYGAMIELFEDSPWLLRVAGFYKPINQLALGYDGVLDIPKDRGSVEIQPAVVYHQVISADVVYRGDAVRTGLSVISDQPSSEDPFADKWTRPVYSSAVIASPFVDYVVAPGWTLSLQHLNTSGGKITEEGALATPDRASITSTTPYQEATQVGLDYTRQLNRRRSFSVNTSYMWSVKNAFQLLKLAARLDLTKDWSVQSELNLVAADALTASNRNDISEFRNNDRMVVGVGYAF